MIIYSQPVFLPGSGTPYTPQRVKAARGPTLIAARSASITKAHRALVLALTAGVDCASRNRATTPLSLSGSVRWTAQLWPQRQHLLNRRQPSLDSTARDVLQILAQSHADQMCANKLACR